MKGPGIQTTCRAKETDGSKGSQSVLSKCRCMLSRIARAQCLGTPAPRAYACHWCKVAKRTWYAWLIARRARWLLLLRQGLLEVLPCTCSASCSISCYFPAPATPCRLAASAAAAADDDDGCCCCSSSTCFFRAHYGCCRCCIPPR